MIKKFFLFFFILISFLYSKNLNYITAIKYKDFPEQSFVRLVLFFVSPPPYFEIKKISNTKLKAILYNTDLTKYVPIVKVKSKILLEIIPIQVKSNVEITFVFNRTIKDYNYIKSTAPNLIYLKVFVSEFEEKFPLESENKTISENVSAKIIPKVKKKIVKVKKKPKQKIEIKPKIKKIKIPKVKIDRAKQIYEIGLSKMASGDYSYAITIFNQILKQFSKNNPYYIKAKFRIADCYYKTMNEKDPHEIMNVAQIYFELVSEYPKSSEAAWGMFQMGNCYIKLGFYEEALASYKYVIKYAPKTIYIRTAMLNVGKILYKFKKYNEAILYFQNIIKNYPNSIVARESYYKLGDCYVALKNYKLAMKYYNYAQEKWPELLNNMPETLYNIGDTFFHLGKYGKAREYFLKIRSLFPKTIYVDMALLKIGETYLKEKKIENALYVYNRVIKVAKDKNNEIIARLRMAEIGLEYKISNKLKKEYGDLVNPEKGFLFIVKNYPQNKLVQIAYSKLIKYYIDKENYKNAVYYLEEFFKKFPLSEIRDLMENNLKVALKGYINYLFEKQDYYTILVYYEKYKGNCLSKVDDINEFLQIALSMKKLFLLNDSNKLFIKILNKVNKNLKIEELIKFNIIENNYYMGKDVLKEIELFLKKFKNSQYNNNLLFYKAEIWQDKKNFWKALQIYKSLLNKKFKEFEVMYKIAKIYQQMGDFVKAEKFYNKLLTSSFSDEKYDLSISDIYFQKAYINFLMHKFQKSINEFNQFIKKFPQDKRITESYFYIGKCYFNLGKYIEAKNIFNLIVKKYKESFWAKLSSYYLNRIKWITEVEKEFSF